MSPRRTAPLVIGLSLRVSCKPSLAPGPNNETQHSEDNDPLVCGSIATKPAPALLPTPSPDATPPASPEHPIAGRCDGDALNCLPIHADRVIGDVFPYRYKPQAARFALSEQGGQQGDCERDSGCELAYCGHACVQASLPSHSCTLKFDPLPERYRKAYCGCVDQRCVWFTQPRQELQLTTTVLNVAYTQSDQSHDATHTRWLLGQALKSSILGGVSFDKGTHRPNVRLCFKHGGFKTGSKIRFTMSLTPSGRPSGVRVTGAGTSLTACLKRGLMAAEVDWSGFPELRVPNVISGTFDAKIVALP